MVISITCTLKYKSGTLDYHETFNPTSFINTIHVETSHPPPSNQPLNMNILSWNVRGATSADFRRVFKDLIVTHRPDVVILTETQVNGDRATAILATLGFDKYVKVDVMGFAGGI